MRSHQHFNPGKQQKSPKDNQPSNLSHSGRKSSWRMPEWMHRIFFGLLLQIRSVFEDYGRTAFLCIVGCLIGGLVACFEAIFGIGLKYCNTLHNQYGPLWLIALPFAGLLIVWLFQRFGKKSQQGMDLVFKVSQGTERWIPKRTVTMMTVATWISHIAGASVGREGVAMQIGAAISHVTGRNLPGWKESKTIFLVAGMAAGFAGLFQTPFTAVFFALEVLVAGVLKFQAMPAAICAAFTAANTGYLLGLRKEAYPLMNLQIVLNSKNIVTLALIGIVCGMAGGLFAWCMHFAKHQLARITPNPYRRILYFSIPLALLLWLGMDGRYSNSGANLIEACFTGGPVYWFDVPAKFFLTVLSLSIGFPGGEVTPMFSIGACMGYFLGPLLGLPAELGAALGYAAAFAGGTNTWLAGICIGMEIFGFQGFPLFFTVCSAAYLVNHSQSIYALQQRES